MLDFTGIQGPDTDFDRLGIVSNDGETLKSVVITTPAGESFKEFKQVQFSAAAIIPSIPELSTWAMMILGFVGLGYASFMPNVKAAGLHEPDSRPFPALLRSKRLRLALGDQSNRRGSLISVSTRIGRLARQAKRIAWAR